MSGLASLGRLAHHLAVFAAMMREWREMPRYGD